MAVPLGLAAVAIPLFNFWLSTHDQPYRALDPKDPVCENVPEADRDVLARSGADTASDKVGNNEWAAIGLLGPASVSRFGCAVQRHTVPGYRDRKGVARTLSYDLAFVEFQENGKPYRLRRSCEPQESCADEGYGPVRKADERRNQLKALFDHLDNPTGARPDAAKSKRPHYVLAFVHGWRHNAAIGDSNVGDFRHYAAHAARFLEERFEDDEAAKPHVTAVYIGWRGARTDETWLNRRLGTVGTWIGTVSAAATLFDRKPVSEAIAPAAISALRGIENHLGIDATPAEMMDLPSSNPNRMIVFGHSLGGNMLATGLKDDLVKKVGRHTKGRYMLPPLGNLVVLINPASEASKWTDIQRAVLAKTAMSRAERANGKEYDDGHGFFRDEQRPVLVSVTASLDWPSGGRGEADCAPLAPDSKLKPQRGLEAGERHDVLLDERRKLAEDRQRLKDLEESRKRDLKEGIEYDSATYDLFPAFKGDLRPVADTIVRIGAGQDPHNQCEDNTTLAWSQRRFGLAATLLGAGLRVLPFMRTDVEDTRTIGHLDPIRPVLSESTPSGFSARPLGTTHELLGRAKSEKNPPRKWCVPARSTQPRGPSDKDCEPKGSTREREIPIDYDEVVGDKAGCAPATGWLAEARERQRKRYEGRGQRWSSDEVEHPPALRFLHGFQAAGIAPTTRANDPFWNMRGLETALARHDGYMLSSFICAMNQLVMDEITSFAPPPKPPAMPAPFPVPTAGTSNVLSPPPVVPTAAPEADAAIH